MEMVTTTRLLLVLAVAPFTWGADFALAIGNPIAVAVSAPGNLAKKDIGMAVRAENCSDPAKVQITGTAEGIADGARRSVTLRVIPAAAGAFAVPHDWPQAGTWVVSLTGHCGTSTASAIVPMGPSGFLRESSKFFPRAATAAEVESVLKTLSGGAK